MPRINVSRVMSNAQFKDSFVAHRKTGSWVSGRFVQTETPINFNGVVVPGGTKDIIQVPEGDRTSEIMIFMSVKEIFVSHDDIKGKGTSDEIEWAGIRYRIYQVKNWSSFGYYRAIGINLGGA